MITDVCTDCRSRNVVDGYVERTLCGKEQKITTKKWCQECLTKDANKRERTAGYMPKLTQTNMKEYLAVIEDYDFIPYAYRWKTSSYYHHERAVNIK